MASASEPGGEWLRPSTDASHAIALGLVLLAASPVYAVLSSAPPTREEATPTASENRWEGDEEFEPVPITRNTQLEVGGVLIYESGGATLFYRITYLYEEFVWVERLTPERSRQSQAPLRLARGRLAEPWRYIPVEAVTRPGFLESFMARRSKSPRVTSAPNAPPPFLSQSVFVQIGNTVYVAGPQRHTIVAIDLTTGQPDPDKLQGGMFRDEAVLQKPSAIVEVGNTLYVAGEQSNTVVAINLASGDLDRMRLAGGVFKNESVLRGPSALVEIGNTLYIAGSQSNTVIAVDVDRGQLSSKQFKRGVFRHEAVLQSPSALVAVGKTLYVAGSLSNSVVAIDMDTGQLDTTKLSHGVHRSEPLLTGPSVIVRIGNTLYVGGSQRNVVLVIDTNSGRVALEPPPASLANLTAWTSAEHPVVPTEPPAPPLAHTPFLAVPASEAPHQFPELTGQIPPGTRVVVLMPTIRLHPTGNTQHALEPLLAGRGGASAVESAMDLADDVRGPYEILLIESRDVPPGQRLEHQAVVQIPSGASPMLDAILRQALSQWLGAPVAKILGSVRLRNGLVAIFV